MTRTLTINGAAIRDIPSFYDEVNRVFMGAEDWKLGPSLDALSDMFYGGFGAISGREPVRLVWRDIDKSREALGHECIVAFYEAKLAQPELFNAEQIRRQLAALQAGHGQTYFEIILEIIAEHPNIELVRA